ncbi:MAG: 1-aminocyclopropane-1-carboxylate deaminase [Flavobacteriales bacterium]|nr:MAG: 1-aminocyclopropane-1-carboxylate deaminase [Flavobacteriales bacterium]
MLPLYTISKNEPVYLPKFPQIQLFMKREDQIHPAISGNKFRKLKYNLATAKLQNHHTLLTFGGAYSNHIAAVAAAGKENGFKTIGIIRGEELVDKIVENPTLSYAKSCGMEFIFVDRSLYRNKENPDFLNEIKRKYGRFYHLPEGGTNSLAVKGCEEILTKEDACFDYICVAVGTGGTISGIVNSSSNNQTVIGFPALKGDFLVKEIKKWVNKCNWSLETGYHFNGYAKINFQLVSFINWFKSTYGIPLDPVYTGKMMFGIVEMIKNGTFKKNARILAIHTGGLQGIAGMNQLLKKKGLSTIQ